MIATSAYETLDPAKETIDGYKASTEPMAAVLDTLVRIGSDGEVEPQLAESMETEDGLVWTMTLREGVSFTDGTPFDAEAVVTNIERQQDPELAGVAGRNLAGLESVEATDEHTVVFTLSSVDATFAELFAGVNGMILSPQAIEDDPEQLVGAGAYTLEEVVADSHILLQRNPDYWDDTKPAYETVRYRQIPDALARAEALAAGEVDIAQTTGAETILQLGDLESAGIRFEQANGTYMVLMNHSRGPAQDVRVREAVSLAFDPERVNDTLLGGLWDEIPPALELPCPPFRPDDPECVEGSWPEHDAERAEELIQEYVDEGGSVEVTLTGNSENLNELEFIQQTLDGIGMDVTIDALPTPEYVSAVTSTGEFDMAYWTMTTPLPMRVRGSFHTEAQNLPRGDIEGLDEALDEVRATLDADERNAAWGEVLEIMNGSFAAAWYGPWLAGNLMEDTIDMGDQRGGTQFMWITELSSADG